VEYVGMVVAVGVLLVGLVAVFPSIGDAVTCKLSQAVASVTGGASGCSGATSAHNAQDGAEPAVAANPTPTPWQPPPTEPARVPGVPRGLDPNSDLVKTMQSTPRGRAALQWLDDHNVRVEINPSKTGGWYRERGPLGSGGYIVLGNGFDNAPTLIHETNHAKRDKGYRSSAYNIPSRELYVQGKIREETDGVVQAILAAKEFRAAGRTVPDPPGEREYDNAYQKAKSNGASNADAEQAGYDAVEHMFNSGVFRTSTNSKPYPEYYRDAWNRANLCFLYPWCH